MTHEPAPGNEDPQAHDVDDVDDVDEVAFSPTDTMPLVPRAKIAMTAQSYISLAILGLVVARA